MAFKRKLCIGGTTAALPLYYLIKHRNNIYRGSKLQREFYVKEIMIRSVLGFVLGIGLSIYFYGPEENRKKVLGSEGVAEIDGKEVQKSSLEYSVAQKKKFLKRNDFLPGKIRDDEQ